MTLYFDTKVQFLDADAISTISAWHPNENLFAVASFSQDRGGSVTVFDDAGEPLRNVTYPVYLVQQVTALAWNPERKFLIAGWENGEIYSWMLGQREFSLVNGPHKSPIVVLAFSEKGGRMVSVDSAGILTGWKCDSSGQFLTMFNHDLKDTLLSVTFKKTIPSSVNTELAALAKAAVAGDEIALDTLTTWRPRTTARALPQSNVADNFCFYVGTQSGIVYFVNQSGTCTEVLRSNEVGVVQILCHPKREAIVILMEDMAIGHYLVESNGSLTELDRVKLSSQAQKNGLIAWAGGSGLAIITGDLSVRIWDIDTGYNYLLSLDLPNANSKLNGKQSGGQKSSATELFTCIAFCADNQTLCAGTNQGNLYTWKRTNLSSTSAAGIVDVPENAWQLNNISNIKGAIKQCMWGITNITKSCILINCITNVFVLKEHLLKSSHTRNIWAVQKSANEIYCEHSSGQSTTIITDISVVELCLNENNLILTNGKSIIVYKILFEDDIIGGGGGGAEMTATKKSFHIKTLNTFVVADCLEIFLYDQNIITLGQSDIKILSLGGIVLQNLLVTDAEGQPIGADLTSKYLTMFTLNGYIKIYDISRHEPKLLTQSKSAYDLFENFGEIINARCNSDGTQVLMTIATENLIPDGKIYVWNIEKNLVCEFDFAQEQDNIKRMPITFYWDDEDTRLFAVETRTLQTIGGGGGGGHKISNTGSTVKLLNQTTSGQNQSNSLSVNLSDSQIGVMFVNDNGKIYELETINLIQGEQLVNMCAPFVVILKVNQINRLSLRDFKGLEECDLKTRKMVLDFSLNVALGNMDQAFRCIRFLQSNVVWENLAQMCIQTGRLDVAKVCLGYLKRARSVRALTKALNDKTLEPDAKVAVLAIELGMNEVAENLYKKCGRYDLLNNLLQASGKFEEALQIAEQCDRIHLKNTYFKYAEWLKLNGDLQSAIDYYEKSSSPIHNITQLLMDDPVVLKQYIANTTNVNLLKWWAQYIESTGDMDAAFKTYQKANDWFSQIRILCFLGQVSRADSLARSNGDRSACYFLARHYENIGKIQDSIQLYTRAKSYTNAVRICKENDLQDELWSVANLAQPREKASAASYFEDNNDCKRAVELYYRAGKLHEAVEMAFNSQQPDILQVIASEFDEKTDPELVQRCSEFFVSIEQPQKAVQLLANARQFESAIKICIDYNVPVTESLGEALTPNKDEFDQNTRNRILLNLGEILQQQGDYHSATKKFTQAGDKIRAMKSLLKSGDTDKIIFYASMSRQREVYLMAANYLQLSHWQSDPKILKNIVAFYTKAQSFDLLANFYVTCGQVEIDEFRDYRKALKAIQEARKCLTKLPEAQNKVEKLQKMMMNVKQMIELYDAMEQGENQTVMIGCRQILALDEQPPVRHGDVLALHLEALVNAELYSEALGCFREIATKIPDWGRRNLIEKPIVEKLAHECGLDFDTLWQSGNNRGGNQNRNETRGEMDNDDGDGEYFDEEIVEEI